MKEFPHKMTINNQAINRKSCSCRVKADLQQRFTDLQQRFTDLPQKEQKNPI